MFFFVVYGDISLMSSMLYIIYYMKGVGNKRHFLVKLLLSYSQICVN